MKFVFTKGPWVGLFCFLLVLVSTACSWQEHKLRSQPVISVNGKTLSAKEFAEQLARRLKRLDALSAKDPANLKRTKSDLVRVFILNAMIENFAKENSISVSDEELETEVNAIRSGYPDDLSFRRVLAEEGLSLSEWKQALRLTLLSRKVFQEITKAVQDPTVKELQAAYDKDRSRFKRGERIYLRQIILDDITKAEAVRDQIRKGRESFAEMAKKYSVAPEGKNGGLVGWVERGSVDIFDKAFSLPVGGVSKVLESTYGFHIFKVERKASPGFAQFGEVRAELESEMRATREQAEFSSWLDRQIRTSRVSIDQGLIDGITVETRGKVKK